MTVINSVGGRVILVALTLALGLILQTAQVRAAVIFERPLHPTFGGRFSNQSDSLTFNRAANSFVLSEDATVTDVHWWGYFESETATTTAGFRIRFYTDTAGSPGGNIFEQMVDPAFSDTGQTRTIGINTVPVLEITADPVMPLALSAGVTYWLEIAYLAPTASDEFLWARATTSDGLVAQRNSDGASWNVVSPPDSDLAFALTSTVPEPTTLALLATGVVLIGLRRRPRSA